MDRSYKIYKSYHTSHHNTTKTHLQISTPPSSVQQRTDAHNLPNKHIESQASKLQASSNAPTFTTSLQTTRNLKLPNYKRPATRRRSQPPRQTTRKLSLSSQPSSAALMSHPTPGNPLNPPALINPHFRQSPHTPTTTSRPEPNSLGDGCRLATTLQKGSRFLAGGNLRCF